MSERHCARIPELSGARAARWQPYEEEGTRFQEAARSSFAARQLLGAQVLGRALTTIHHFAFNMICCSSCLAELLLKSAANQCRSSAPFSSSKLALEAELEFRADFHLVRLEILQLGSEKSVAGSFNVGHQSGTPLFVCASE